MTSMINTLFGRMSHAGQSGTLLDRLNSALALSRSRARLAELEPHMLADIGLTQKDAMSEANRPVWDAPDAWKA